MVNAVQNIWRHADANPDHVALRVDRRSWSYGELRAHARNAARELAGRGVTRGDRVLIMLPTSAEFVFVYHGVLALGAVAVTVNTLCTPREIDYFHSDAECVLAVGCPDTRDALLASSDRPAWIVEPDSLVAARTPVDNAMTYVEADPVDAAVLLYTSGTTGSPKGAVLTHGNLLACGRSLSQIQGLEPEDRVGTALPLFHVFGQASVMASVQHAGAALSLLRPFDAVQMLDMAVSHRLTMMAGVPTMWNEMLHADTPITADDLPDLRYFLTGGAPLPHAVRIEFETRFGARVLDGYGLSETTGAATGQPLAEEPKEGSVGRAVPGCQLAILGADHQPVPAGEIGEVAVQGPNVMREYWNRPDATAAVQSGPWFLTGDLGRMDEDGDLWIVGRLKELIIRGGYNVYPAEVEDVLYRHPAVVECAVIGIPDERLGEEVAAVLVLQPGHDLDVAQVRTWLGERLASYKVPRVYHLRDALPKGSTGKILKRAIDVDDVAQHGIRTRRSDSTKATA
ncbi:long-chain fatty acid--CoA ligase [Nocardioides ginsengisoli]|uniref:Long-chain acyl-CoA synthetase n=2 Tax=Nocardioides TaxID=1839 RepID=A0A852RLR5_9ACTN|nr:AMP-binding protein [Nocardioides kongjuensis]NYD31975.1 long-chain acyl-CoA synthetase [Nocardioides kongjuensis]